MSEIQKEKLRVAWKKKLVRQKSETIEKEKEKEKETVYGKKYRQDKYGQYDVYRYE